MRRRIKHWALACLCAGLLFGSVAGAQETIDLSSVTANGSYTLFGSEGSGPITVYRFASPPGASMPIGVGDDCLTVPGEGAISSTGNCPAPTGPVDFQQLAPGATSQAELHAAGNLIVVDFRDLIDTTARAVQLLLPEYNGQRATVRLYNSLEQVVAEFMLPAGGDSDQATIGLGPTPEIIAALIQLNGSEGVGLFAFGPVCGDGLLERDEDCDDGNLADGDGCSSECAFEAVCGDGTVDDGEQCDDGNTAAGDGCDATCQIESVCGDGVVEGDEQCDDGNTHPYDGCDADCQNEPVCGNGILEGDEACDDGNLINGDGCNRKCEVETECGNGILEGFEECDDGNDIDGDGCDSNCMTEEGFCGDGVVDPGEQCDDGNDDNDDGCRNDCTIPVCGDGMVDPGEQCDDGNDDNDDGCRNDCTIPVCGDGMVDPGEQCDDGNDNNDDGCRNDCTIPVCGDGMVDPGEQCDDGNDNNDDGCRNDCTIPVCGDGMVDPGEQCDDGNDNNDDGCRNDCTIPVCGDGMVDPGEQCDDGNDDNDDGCRNDCTIPVCGDGMVDPGEQCDDGNDDNDDGCRNDCTIPVCGDGMVDPGEQCDDGNDDNDDGCRNDCTIPVCGDGMVDPGEQCDDGNDNNADGCRNNCTIPICGDGIVDPGEQCDDANDNNDDGCRNDCTIPVCGDGIVDPGEECDDGNDVNDDDCANDCTVPPCGLSVNKQCTVIEPELPQPFTCDGKVDTLTMRYDGSFGALLGVQAFAGDTGAAPLAVSIDGDIVSVSGYQAAGAPNDVVWLFQGADGSGSSTFHLSCSDSEMDGETDEPAFPNDCGRPEGDGKNNDSGVNAWLLEGLATDGGNVLQCTPVEPVLSESCSFEAVFVSCDTLPSNPDTLTWRYTGGGCAASDNDQDSGDLFCTETEGGVDGGQAVTITDDGDNVFVVEPGGTFTTGRGDSKVFTLVNAGGSEQNGRHVSCSQPLQSGDVYGSLTLVGLDGVMAGRDVLYTYDVVNNGNAPITGITVDDDKLGQIASGLTLQPGESVRLEATAFLEETTTNIAPVSGDATGVATCEDSDAVTVMVPEPPPCTVSAVFDKLESNKIKFKVRNDGFHVATLDTFVLNFPAGYEAIKKVKLDGDIYRNDESSLVVTSGTVIGSADWTESNVAKRQLDPGEERTLEIEFVTSQDKEQFLNDIAAFFSGSITFEEGCASDL